MKLKQFNAENTRVVRQGTACIGVNQKTGVFNINQVWAKLIGLKHNDQVVIHQDEDDPENWYIEKVKSNGFTVRGKDVNGGIVMFNNSALARAIGTAMEIEGSYRMMVLVEPTIYEKRKLFGLAFRIS